MIDRVRNLKKHLEAQIRKAEKLDSKWVYILEEEARTCLKLAESEEEILKQLEPLEPELEGGGRSWWYVCDECHGAIDFRDRYCRHCGRRQEWKSLMPDMGPADGAKDTDKSCISSCGSSTGGSSRTGSATDAGGRTGRRQ